MFLKYNINYNIILYNINFRRDLCVLLLFIYKRKVNLLTILWGVLKKGKMKLKYFKI